MYIYVYMYIYIYIYVYLEPRAQIITTINVFLVPRGGRTSVVPAISVDTLRGEKKEDPQL